MSRGAKASAAAPSGPRAVPHGVLVAIAVGVLSVAGALIYAGSAAVEVAYRLIVDGGFVLAWLAAAAGWGSLLMAWACTHARARAVRAGSVGDGPEESDRPATGHDDSNPSLTLSARRSPASQSHPGSIPHDTGMGTCLCHRLVLLVTAIALGLGILGLLVLALGLAGALSQVTSILLLGFGIVLGVWMLARSRSTLARPSPAEPSTRWNWLWLLVVPMVSLALVAAFVPPGMLWKPHEPHGYDVVEYHFQIPREWHDAGRIQSTPHNAFGYLPFGVEMHYLLAMHLRGGAWDGMYLAHLMHLMMTVLAVIAACGFANQIATDRRVAIAASVLGATTPWLAQLAPIGFNEGGLLLFGTVAIGWSLHAIGVRRRVVDDDSAGSNDSSGGQCPPYAGWIVAGLAAGFACGVKLTAAPLLLAAIPVVAVGVMLLSARSWKAIRPVVIGSMLFVAVGMAAFSPWLVRNAVWAGNPVFPEGRAVFGNGPFTQVQVDRWQAAHSARPDQQSVVARTSALVDQVIAGPQFGYVLLPLGVIALALGWRNDACRFLALLLSIHVVFWLGFTHLQGRFFVLGIPIAVLGIAAGGAAWTTAKRMRTAIAGSLAGVAVFICVVSTVAVHRPLAHKLYQEQGTGLAVVLGNEDLSWITQLSLERFPLNDPNARLVLVGDAQAFWYPLDASRLQYRTVFDLDTQRGSLLDAFDPHGWRQDGKTWLLIAPSELERYAKTYQPLPAIPAKWKDLPQWKSGLPFLVPPQEVGTFEAMAQ